MGYFLTFYHCDVKMTSYIKILIQGLKIAPYAKFELDEVIILKIIQVSLFFEYESNQKYLSTSQIKNLI